MNALQELFGQYGTTDAVLLAQTPTVMMPRAGALPELPAGRKRLVAAQDGWYLQASSTALRVTVRLAASPVPLPYGALSPSIELAGGLIPRALFEQMRLAAAKACPREWAAFVVYEADRSYRIQVPEYVSQSNGHISYRLGGVDESAVALDLHSHGRMPAFFSATDDRSDQHGLYIASVLGNLGAGDSMSCVSRLVCDGWHFEMEWNPWEDPDGE